MAKAVTIILPTINPLTRMPKTSVSRRRVAAYARVSTDSDEQITSYKAQIAYYTRYIKSHSDWQFVKVQTDEDISGTNIKHRDGFNEMVNDALAGKIDLIVTKSVSRFARNTVDSLVAVRKLKEEHPPTLRSGLRKKVFLPLARYAVTAEHFFGSKDWRSTDKYRKVIWQCNSKFNG